MRTTLNLDDELVRRAKRRALDESTTLTALIETALRHHLRRARPRREPFHFRPLTKRGRLRPGINIDDRDSLLDAMDGR